MDGRVIARPDVCTDIRRWADFGRRDDRPDADASPGGEQERVVFPSGGAPRDAVARRVITLILLRRHGVALFHDIYGNALSALPKVFASLGRVIDWPDCHLLARL